ncbi:MAG: hypothetical protein WC805_03150 [Patescibacteria group bacterium]
MKKFLKDLALFIGLTLLIYPVLVIVWGELIPGRLIFNLNYPRGGYGHTYSRIHEIDQYPNVDVLFVGSSHVYRGFDTRIFAAHRITSFNLGSSLQTPIQTKLLLERYLDIFNPKLIIYEVCHDSFSSDGVESSLDIIANDRIGWDTWQMVGDTLNIKTINALIFGLYKQQFSSNANFIEPATKNGDTYISGGYVEKTSAYYQPQKHTLSSWVLNSKQTKTFRQTVNMINEREIKLLVVQAPVTKILFDSYANNNEIDAWFKELAPYVNFNNYSQLQLSDTQHFYDDQHLNQIGVELFNNQLIDYLFSHALVNQELRYSFVDMF